MIAISLHADSANRSPFQDKVRTASPEQLTELIQDTLGLWGFTTSATVWEGWIAIHSDALVWELYCVVSNTDAEKPTIDLIAVSDTWCESRKLVSIVCKELATIGVSLNCGLNLPVRVAPVPRWF